MGSFRNIIEKFAELARAEEKWKSQGEQSSLRGILLGISGIFSISSFLIVLTISESLMIAATVAGAVFALSAPAAIFAASRLWKERLRSAIKDDDDFNWRMYLEDEYEEQIRKIDELKLDKAIADKLKSEAYQQHRRIVRKFQLELASRKNEFHKISVKDFLDVEEKLAKRLNLFLNPGDDDEERLSEISNALMKREDRDFDH